MKLLICLFTLTLSFASFALPAQTDELIKELTTNNVQFQQLMENESGYQSLTIKRVNLLNMDIREKCQNMSRSGSVLEVSLEVRTTGRPGMRCRGRSRCGSSHLTREKKFYFSTHHRPESLTLCK